MLIRRRSKKSKVRTYSIAVISLLILACELWYVDALNAREPKSSRMAISQQFVSYYTSTSIYPLTIDETGGTTNLITFSSPLTVEEATQLPSSPLRGEEEGGGDSFLFSVNDGKLNLAHILESVCVGSDPCTPITVAQLHTKEAK